MARRTRPVTTLRTMTTRVVTHPSNVRVLCQCRACSMSRHPSMHGQPAQPCLRESA